MNFKARHRPFANASLISMLQRFSDIATIFFGLYFICLLVGEKFNAMHLFMVMTALVCFQMFGGMTDFYRSWRGVSLFTEIQLVLQNWTLALIVTAGFVSFFDVFEVDFKVYGYWFLLVSVGLLFARAILRKGIGALRYRGYNTRNVAIVGSLSAGNDLAENLINAPWLGMHVTAMYGTKDHKHLDNVNYIDDIWQVIKDAKAGAIDRIYIAMPMNEELKIKKLIDELYDTTCSVMLIPDIFTFSILQSRSEDINGMPVLSITDTPFYGVNMVLKRIEDIIASSLILLLISPALFTIALAVKITSPGPVIFRQVRYGIDGKPIKVWKFRSMNVMENGEKVVQASKGDKRLTSIGGLLRRTSLDELPQFFNVLFGDMSIVGPRPHAVAHNEQYRSMIKGYMLRHKVKPGITGWAQINGWRGETDTLEKMEKRIEYDLAYIRDWSIALDLRIIFLTVFKGFVNKSAY